jgi:hypothetical protein
MKYTRKTKDVWEIQGYYSRQYGYECVTSEETYKEAKIRLREYRENEPGISFKITLKREKI